MRDRALFFYAFSLSLSDISIACCFSHLSFRVSFSLLLILFWTCFDLTRSLHTSLCASVCARKLFQCSLFIHSLSLHHHHHPDECCATISLFCVLLCVHVCHCLWNIADGGKNKREASFPRKFIVWICAAFSSYYSAFFQCSCRSSMCAVSVHNI